MRLSAFILLSGLLTLTIGCGKKDGAQASANDQAKFDGVWKIEKIDMGEPGKGPPPEFFEKMRFAFKDGKMYMFESDEDYEHGTYTLDATQEPRHISMTKLDEKGEPRKEFKDFKDGKPVYGDVKVDVGIYKFDGDKLVMAILEGKGDRPKDFKAVPWKKPEAGKEPDFNQGTVSVVTMSKTTDPVPAFKPKKPRDTFPPPVPAPPTKPPTPPDSTLPKAPDATTPPLPKLPSPPDESTPSLPKLPTTPELPKPPEKPEKK